MADASAPAVGSVAAAPAPVPIELTYASFAAEKLRAVAAAAASAVPDSSAIYDATAAAVHDAAVSLLGPSTSRTTLHVRYIRQAPLNSAMDDDDDSATCSSGILPSPAAAAGPRSGSASVPEVQVAEGSGWGNSDARIAARGLLQPVVDGTLIPLYIDEHDPSMLVKDVLREGQERDASLRTSLQRGLLSRLEAAVARADRLGSEALSYYYRGTQHLSDRGLLPDYHLPDERDFLSGRDPRTYLRDPFNAWTLQPQRKGVGGRRKQESFFKRESARSRLKQQMDRELKDDMKGTSNASPYENSAEQLAKLLDLQGLEG